MATVTAAQQRAVANLYSALFNRAPDADGFVFWTEALANGATLSRIAAAFVATPEARANYVGAQTAEQFVAAFYTTVFGRAPDAGGLAFWTTSLNAAGGVVSDIAKAQLVVQIIDVVNAPLSVRPAGLTDAQYAQTVADRATFFNKATVGVYFAADLKGTDPGLARQVLGVINADAASIQAAKAVATGTSGGGSGGGVATFHLGAGVDTLVGTAGADRFSAGLADPTASTSDGAATLTPGDRIDGGAGIDRINLIGNANAAAFAGADIKNIEVVHALLMNGALDVSGNADVAEAWLANGSGLRNTFTLTKAQMAGLQGDSRGGANTFVFLDTVGNADKATLALADASSYSDNVIAGIESLNINVTGNSLMQRLTVAALETLAVTGTGTLTTRANGGSFTFVDASANSGGLFLDISSLVPAARNVIGTSAQDELTINLANLSAADRIDLGAGRDTLGFSVTDLKIDGTTAANFAGIKNVETLKFNGAITATVDGSVTAISSFYVNTTGLSTFTQLASTDIITIGAVKAAANQYGMEPGQSTFNLDLAGVGNDNVRAAGQTVTGASVVNIGSTGGLEAPPNELGVTAAARSTFVVRGTKDLILNVGNASGTLGQKIDASAFGAKLDVSGSVRSDVIIGGASNDTINGGTITFAADAIPVVPGVAERQTVWISGGFGPNTATTFLGVSVYHGVNLNLDQMARVLETNKAAILAGPVALAAGITDIVRTGPFSVSLAFTVGLPGDPLAGPRPSVPGSSDNGYDFSSGDRARAGVFSTPEVPAVPQSLDTLTGGAGADIFVFSTGDNDSAHGALTSVITDFTRGLDKLKLAGIGTATAGKFLSVQASAADLGVLLSAADDALDGTVQIYVGRIGADSYVVTDVNGTGYTNVIKLAGVGPSGVTAADFIA